MAIDSVVRMGKINYPQVYLEECKYKIKKMFRFINSVLESESESELSKNQNQNQNQNLTLN